MGEDMIIAIDTETTFLPPKQRVRISHHVPELVCISAKYQYDNDLEVEKVWEAPFDNFKKLMEVEDATLVFHNAPFDLSVLARAGIDLRERVLAGKVLDTQVMAKLRHPPKRPYTLASLAKTLLSRDLDKGAVRTSFRPGVPLTTAQRRYAVEDAVATYDVFRALQDIPFGGMVGRDYEKLLCTDASYYRGQDPDVLYSTASALTAFFLEPEGLEVDRDLLLRLRDEHIAETEKLLVALYDVGLAKLQRVPKSVIQHGDIGEVSGELPGKSWERYNNTTLFRQRKGALEYTQGRYSLNETALRGHYQQFAEDNGIDAPTSEKTGAVSMAYDFWKLHKEGLPKALKIHLELGKKRKYLSCFLEPPHACRAERIYPGYIIPGAETGRWACYGPNLQQLPKSLRGVYRAPRGYRFVSVDYKSLELYTLANSMLAMGIRGPLLAALESGADVHDLVAHDLGSGRQDAKACNFGLPGGMGVKRFFDYGTQQLMLDWDRDKAERMHRAWFDKFWDVRQYLELFEVNPYEEFLPEDYSPAEWLEELGHDPEVQWPSRFSVIKSLNEGKIYTCVLPSGRVLPTHYYSKAANAFFQGPGADVITTAFVKVIQANLRPVAVIHDSITVVEEESNADLAGISLVSRMQEALREVCPGVPAPLPEFEVSEVLK